MITLKFQSKGNFENLAYIKPLCCWCVAPL